MRINEHSVLGFEPRRSVEFTMDDVPFLGLEGEPIAAALLANGILFPDEEAALRDADPIVCRCEEIRRSEVLEAIAAGCTSVQAIRRYSVLPRFPGFSWQQDSRVPPL